MTRVPHRQLVAQKLARDGSANAEWAASHGHIQLRTRIHELRRLGWVIETEPDGRGEGYVLIALPDGTPLRPLLWP